jgi:hypothetical protein
MVIPLKPNFFNWDSTIASLAASITPFWTPPALVLASHVNLAIFHSQSPLK